METGKIILVIDDDRDFQTLLRTTLNQSGFKVRSAFDGEIGTLLEQPRPDIILLDMDLPFANGIEVGRLLKLHEATRDIPVIMVSANPFLDNLSREAGAIDFVQKPFAIRTLIEKVEDHLALSA